jgi:predicted nucleic acid-binding protein
VKLLAVTRPEDRETLWLALGNLPWADLDQVAWRQAGELANDLRRRGVSVSLTDVTIAVASVNAEAELWSRDGDFARIRDAWPALALKA